MRDKPNMTFLFRDSVSKDNPRLVLRGKLDSIYALAQHIYCEAYKERRIDNPVDTLTTEFAKIANAIEDLQGYEAIGGENEDIQKLVRRADEGIDRRQLKNRRCRPTTALGGLTNILRTQIREAELAAWNMTNSLDVVPYEIGKILNMLSTWCMWIMVELEDEQLRG